MSHKPGHITGNLAATWDELYAQAAREQIDAKTQPVVVKDESKLSALEALAAVGGAEVTDAEGGGKSVRLSFGEEVEGDEHHEEEPQVTAAAKPHRFADELE